MGPEERDGRGGEGKGEEWREGEGKEGSQSHSPATVCTPLIVIIIVIIIIHGRIQTGCTGGTCPLQTLGRQKWSDLVGFVSLAG